MSGLALGIDAAAHRVALSTVQNTQASCATIAIVGTVLDRVYPSRHQISQQGLLLIELPIGMGPLGHYFPRRNRLIGRHQ
ncbi:MAG: DNA-processing protein DprA [Burkholderiaceae bacterium]